MSPPVQFIFDFGSPNAYLSHLVLPEIEKRTGVTFEYVPCLLGGIFKMTNNRSPMEAFGGVRNKPEFMQLETQRFVQRHGITAYERNPHFPVNTLAIMRGAVFAQKAGIGDRYIDEVYRHMWAKPLKMDDPEVIRVALERSGLPVDEIFEGTGDPAIKKVLIDNTSDAVERGVFGSPSFFVGDELYFGKDQLRDVEEAIQAAS